MNPLSQLATAAQPSYTPRRFIRQRSAWPRVIVWLFVLITACGLLVAFVELDSRNPEAADQIRVLIIAAYPLLCFLASVAFVVLIIGLGVSWGIRRERERGGR